MAEQKIIKSGNKRYLTYVFAGVVMVAAIVATLITMGLFSMDDVQDWIALVVTLVVAIVGLAQSVLSALNTDREPVAGAEEPPAYVPPRSMGPEDLEAEDQPASKPSGRRAANKLH